MSEGKLCACGIGPRVGGGVCRSCGGVDPEAPMLFSRRAAERIAPAPLTEQDVRRIAREEIAKSLERMIDFAERLDGDPRNG